MSAKREKVWGTICLMDFSHSEYFLFFAHNFAKRRRGGRGEERRDEENNSTEFNYNRRMYHHQIFINSSSSSEHVLEWDLSAEWTAKPRRRRDDESWRWRRRESEFFMISKQLSTLKQKLLFMVNNKENEKVDDENVGNIVRC